ncbi:hypothetical protein [Pseudomonas plecoglossicida]
MAWLVAPGVQGLLQACPGLTQLAEVLPRIQLTLRQRLHVTLQLGIIQ